MSHHETTILPYCTYNPDYTRLYWNLWRPFSTPEESSIADQGSEDSEDIHQDHDQQKSPPDSKSSQLCRNVAPEPLIAYKKTQQ